MKKLYLFFLIVLCVVAALIVTTLYNNGGYFVNIHAVRNEINKPALATSLAVNSYIGGKTSSTADEERTKNGMFSVTNTSKPPGVYMNTTVDPCEDFYEYSCGNYPHLADVDLQYPKFSMFTRIDRKTSKSIVDLLSSHHPHQAESRSTAVDKARRYYHACLIGHTDKHHVIASIERFLLWYVENKSLSLETFLASTHRRGIHTLLKLTVEPDAKNSTQHQIVFDIPTSALTLQNTAAYRVEKNNKQVYAEYIVKVFTLLDISERKVPALKFVTENIDQMWILEKHLAELLRQTRHSGKVDEKIPLRLNILQKNVDRTHQVINLTSYMETLLTKEISRNEVVSVLALDYFQNLSSVIKQTNKSVLVSYMLWHAILSLSEVPAVKYLLHPANTIIAPITGKHTQNTHPAVPTKEKCAGMTRDSLIYAVMSLYLEEYYNPQGFQKFKDIYSGVMASLRGFLDEGSHWWMTRPVIHLYRAKTRAMKGLLGFPKEFSSQSMVTDYYRKLEISETNSVSNQLNVLKWQYSVNLEKYHQPYNRSKSWDMNPLHCNARYEHVGNRVLFPIALLQEPFFDPDRHMSSNFGSIGFLIAHEMTHAFDKKGTYFHMYGEYDADPNHKDTLVHLKKVETCFLNQFSNYTVLGTKMNVNIMLDENLADTGGLFLATKAFNTLLLQKPQQHQQQPSLLNAHWREFFLAFAQTWCTTYTKKYTPVALKYDTHTYAKFRVLGTLSNSKEFAHTYNCPVGSPMNPVQKCAMW